MHPLLCRFDSQGCHSLQMKPEVRFICSPPLPALNSDLFPLLFQCKLIQYNYLATILTGEDVEATQTVELLDQHETVYLSTKPYSFVSYIMYMPIFSYTKHETPPNVIETYTCIV